MLLHCWEAEFKEWHSAAVQLLKVKPMKMEITNVQKERAFSRATERQ